jgi:hypothetical protein
VGDDVRRLAVQQRKRVVAGILGAAEHSAWWSRLSERERVEYRNKVLGSLNTYHDFMLDVISVGDEDPHSQQVIQLLEAVHSSQLRLERQTVPHG